jgi:hypothetical protein
LKQEFHTEESGHCHVNPAGLGSNLNGVANDKDGHTAQDALASAKPISSAARVSLGSSIGRDLFLLGSSQGTDQAANAHQRHERGLDDGLPVLGAAIGVLVLCEAVAEVGEDEETGDLTSVVAKEETTDGGGDAEDEGLGAAVGAVDLEGPVTATIRRGSADGGRAALLTFCPTCC